VLVDLDQWMGGGKLWVRSGSGSLPHWVRHYNERRTHSARSNRPPIQRVRGVTGLNT